jgi:RimJ/RimL family protein N-acetyltransferase
MRAVTITYLEMRSPAALKPKRCPDPRFWIKQATVAQWEFNRFLYLFVGGPWTWTDKLNWTDCQWKEYVESGRLWTYVGYYDGSLAGYYELQRDEIGDIEIIYFGLTPHFIGRGLGGVLLTSALEEAWGRDPKRVWVHTCTLDHPAAVATYQACGMQIYKSETHPPADPPHPSA